MQTPIDPRYPELRRRRFRPIPVRMLVPNFITLLAICAGLTAIRLSTEGRMELAVGAIVFALFMAFVIVGVSNAVNLTDGLDGLAAGVLIFCFVAYLFIALVDPPGALRPQPNLAIFCALIVGALMGFLWFNVHPAQIFMGDSGALGLGATLAVVATLSRQLPLLAVIGIVFFAVIMSVVLQVVSFRCRGRRIFRMAPLQHHFELIGWAEEKITVRFWIVGALAGLLGFSVFLGSTFGMQ